jgi:hypothetical protein
MTLEKMRFMFYNQKLVYQQKSAQNFIPTPYFALKTATTLHLHQTKKTCAQLGQKK